MRINVWTSVVVFLAALVYFVLARSRGPREDLAAIRAAHDGTPAEAATDPDTDVKADTDAKTDSDPDAKADAGTDVKADPDTGATAEVQASAEADQGAEAAKTGTANGTTAEPAAAPADANDAGQAVPAVTAKDEVDVKSGGTAGKSGENTSSATQ